MADFPTYAPPLTYTSVLASTILSSVSPISTAAVPIGSGQAPFESQATAVDFLVAETDGAGAAPGNLTYTFQASSDGSTWFTTAANTFVGPVPSGSVVKFTLPVNSRQWRFVRMQAQCATAQTGGQEATLVVRAKLQGLGVPFTKA